MDKLIVDLFAGGGGASTGIELALGRSPDIAVNHDAIAVAMHEVNHPTTLHFRKNVWQVHPVEVVGRRKVGLLWASPDCTHFSKAKGGKPVKKHTRDLAWVIVLWAQKVRPDVIAMENVEEFVGWGPLGADDRPDPARKGETFDKFVRQLRKLGYKVQWKELRACDFGAPTIRKRLFIIARCDGLPIVWPAPTHGGPDSEGVTAGRLLPWRTAAEVIDWSIPCPSIFLTPAEAKRIGVKRPLADATMARIAKGIKRYVLDNASPFIVSTTHQGGDRVEPIDEPMRTVTGAHRGEKAVVSPFLAPRYGERPATASAPGQEPRTRPLDVPLATIVPDSNQGSLIAPLMVQANGERSGVKHGRDPRAPLSTVTANGHHQQLAAATIVKANFGDKPAHSPDEPLHTVTTQGNKHSVVAAFLAQHNLGVVGHDAREPVSTITQKGSQQTVVSAGLQNLKGSHRGDAPITGPTFTQTGKGWHQAEVRAFLLKYYGTDQDPRLEEPLHTLTAKSRFGLVTVEGQDYEIVDVGMRMLSPRELFAAQGFADTYAIEATPDGTPITKTDQIRMVGNSVSPPVARAIIAANCAELAVARRAA